MYYNSERLNFREFNQDDFEILYSLFSNEQVMKYTYLDKYTCKEDLYSYFEDILKNNITKKDREAYEFAVFSENNFIGIADIVIDKQNAAGGIGEIGYLLLPDYWGKGYASEIAKKLIEVAFVDIHLHKIYARCNVNNLNSRKVMEKAGMIREGELRKVRFKNGKWENEYTYGILKEELKY